VARYLADKSALARVFIPGVEQRVAPLLAAGELATCGVVDLEMCFSARNQRDLVELMTLRSASYERLAMHDDDFTRAIEVITELAKKSQHRGVTIPDLLICAVAERTERIVLHYDSDFERIASVTGQEVEWVVPRGSVP
jgi:hypothetical protein